MGRDPRMEPPRELKRHSLVPVMETTFPGVSGPVLDEDSVDEGVAAPFDEEEEAAEEEDEAAVEARCSKGQPDMPATSSLTAAGFSPVITHRIVMLPMTVATPTTPDSSTTQNHQTMSSPPTNDRATRGSLWSSRWRRRRVCAGNGCDTCNTRPTTSDDDAKPLAEPMPGRFLGMVDDWP